MFINDNEAIDEKNLYLIVKKIVDEAPVFDMHTHLFPPSFLKLFLCGIDEMLTYHYLVAELFRVAPITPNKFWALSKTRQAEVVWVYLFEDNLPVSEAAIGVLTILHKLGIDSNFSIDKIREEFNVLMSKGRESYLKKVLSLSNVKKVVMTNDPLDELENMYWKESAVNKDIFESALRLDSILENTNSTVLFNAKKYNLEKDAASFFQDCVIFFDPTYISVSLPDTITVEDRKLLFLCSEIFPLAEKYNLPIVMMIGVRRGVNKILLAAGDGVGKFDIQQLENICLRYPKNKFLVTLLSRENQYELSVLARKFSNLIPFGAWWFLNNPYDNKIILDTRISLLGFSFCPQHSDARVLEHLIYKWEHFRNILTEVLVKKYTRIILLGRKMTKESIAKDVKLLLFDNCEWPKE